MLRTFQQRALAFGPEQAQVTCQIDGNTVFSGAITTVEDAIPTLPDSEYKITNVAWTWQDDVTFDGVKSFSVSVTGSPVLLGPTVANNPYGNAAVFEPFYQIEIDGITYFDPFSQEAIDDEPKTGPYDSAIPGQWWWTIPPGSTFTATMHVNAPPAPPPPPTDPE